VVDGYLSFEDGDVFLRATMDEGTAVDFLSEFVEDDTNDETVRTAIEALLDARV